MSQSLTPATRRSRTWPASALAVAVGLGALGLAGASPVTADPLVPVGQDIYLADLVSLTPAWFDASTQTWSTLTLPGDSSAVVVSPDATTVYYNSTSLEAVIEVDTATRSVVRTIPLGNDAGFIGGPLLALDPDGTHLFVAGVNGVVTRIDTATGTVTGSIDVGGQLGGVATSQDGATVYVAGWTDNTLVELDAATMTVTRTTPVDNDPQGLQVSPDGSTLYVGHTAVTNDTSAALTVMDTGTAATLWTIPRSAYGAIQGPGNLSLSADGTSLYGVDNLSGYATVDTAAHTSVRALLPASAAPFPYIGLSADSRTALFSMSANGITYLDTATNTLSAPEPRGSFVGGVAFAPDQAPVAAVTAVAGHTGSATTFDASASTASMCSIGTYDWDFGDGTTVTGTAPTIEHTYSQAGAYTVGLTLTTVCGTSTTTVFTGQSLVRNGGPSAVTSTSVVVTDETPDPTETPTTPGPTDTPTTPGPTETPTTPGPTDTPTTPGPTGTPTTNPTDGATTVGAGVENSDGLAHTGAELTTALLGAAGATALGLGVLAARRRRHG